MDRFTRAVEERDRRDWEHDHGGAEGDLRAALTELRAKVAETLKRMAELLRQLAEAKHEAQEQRERAEVAERRLAALTEVARCEGNRWIVGKHLSGRACLQLIHGLGQYATAEAAADAIIAAQGGRTGGVDSADAE